MHKKNSLTRYAWLSLIAALITIGLKSAAYWLTGSVGLLSDALESLVNLAAALMAFVMLRYGARPRDARHHFGHGKAEYFASSFEGALILLAAASIGVAAWDRLQHPQALKSLNWGLAVSALATLINGLVARILLRAGRRYGSIVLEADGKHLLTDVWSSIGVITGLGAAQVSGWQVLDPILALLVAVNIVWAGVGLLRRSFDGFLDVAVPASEREQIEGVLGVYREQGIGFHDVRTRRFGAERFMNVHVLVPGHLTVRAGHDLLEEIEEHLREVLPNLTVTTHLEPREDPRSFNHQRSEVWAAGTGARRPREQGVVAGGATSTRVRETPGRDEPRCGSESRENRGTILNLVGWLLLFVGSAASMVLPELYADLALATALVGFLILLVVLRRRRKLEEPRERSSG